MQERRYTEYTGIYCNAQMNSKLLAMYAQPDAKGLARTIADLEGAEQILLVIWQKPSAIGISTERNWAG